METKVCASCKIRKSIEQFCVNNQQRDGRHVYCRSCQSIINKQWRINNLSTARGCCSTWAKSNPNNLADKALKRNYGISLSDKIAIMESQDYKCAICGDELALGDKHTHLDHDHITGKIRGVLCYRCNHLIGNCCEDSSILQSAIKYLTFYK